MKCNQEPDAREEKNWERNYPIPDQKQILLSMRAGRQHNLALRTFVLVLIGIVENPKRMEKPSWTDGPYEIEA